MINKQLLAVFFGFSFLCPITTVLAESSTNSIPSLKLLVKIDGVEIQGSEKVSWPPTDGAFTAKRGSKHNLSIYVSNNGRLEDVTTSPGVLVDISLGQIQFSHHELLITPKPAFGEIINVNPTSVDIFYFQDSSHKIWGFREIYINIV